MQFSLKWILAGTVYVAVAAAALSQQTWVYSDILWATSLLAIVYAAVLAIVARGRLQAGGGGFVVACALFLMILFYSNGQTTPMMVLKAAGYVPATSASNAPVYYYQARQPAAPPPAYSTIQFNRHLRAANAIATLAFGLLGGLVGLMAFRAAPIAAQRG